MSITIRPIEATDSERWRSLYTGYRAFYRLAGDSSAVETTWQWVIGGEHGLTGLVAVDDTDAPIALANLRWSARPSTGTLGLYLDDLFTAPASRGIGAASALLQRAAEVASKRGANVVRWITAADNMNARRLYDKHADATPWVTHDMKPTGQT